MPNSPHDLDIEPTATASSATDHARFQPTNHVGPEDPKPKDTAIPDAVEIIDVDELPDPSHTWLATKQEPDVKAEPDADGRTWALGPFMTWHNTSVEPIVIEDDGETQIRGQSSPKVAVEQALIDESMELDQPIPLEAKSKAHDAQFQAAISPMNNFESGSGTMLEKHDTRIPKDGIAGIGFQGRLRSIQQTFFKSLRSPPNAAKTPQPLDSSLAITIPDELGTDEMDMDTLDDEAKASWEGFKLAEKEFKNKQDAGTLTMAEEIDFERLKKEEIMRMKKRKEDRLFEKEQAAMLNDDPIFIPMSNEEHVARCHLPPDGGEEDCDAILDDLDNSSDALSGDEQAGASAHNRNQTAQTLEQESFAISWEETLTSKKAKKCSNSDGRKRHTNSREKANSKTADTATVSNASKVTKRGRKPKKQPQPKLPKYTGPSSTDIGSLLTGNLIQDAQANRDLPGLPAMTETHKDKALAKLVASLPPEVQEIAKVDKRAFISATQDFRKGRLRIAEEGGKLSGLNCTLRPHQILGTAWMRRRERSEDQPKGGLVADQMGLGKTIQMLANIIDGRPPENDQGPKTTLIVATPALANQWFEEIKRHCDPKHIGNVIRHHGKNHKFATNDNVATLCSFDIVITTYREVMRSYPKADPPLDLQTEEERKSWWMAHYEKNRGLLHQVPFHRVVVDEAQEIKNHNTRTSIAVRCLNANHRWLLSGTPVQNRLEEFYSYFKFLRLPYTGTFELFKKNFLGDNGLTETGVDRLHAVLNKIMLRRTHLDQLFGRPILKLPETREDVFWVRFNDLERAVYETVRSRMIKRINRLSLSGQADTNYSNFFTMLLGLRQLTGHILMVEALLKDLLEREDIEKLSEIADEEALDVMESVRELQIVEIRKMLALHLQNGEHPNCDHGSGVRTCNDEIIEMPHAEKEVEKLHATSHSDSVGRNYGIFLNFRKYLQELRASRKWDEIDNRTICVLCNSQAEDPWVVSCMHIYCFNCLNMLVTTAATGNKDKARCVQCGMEFHGSHPCDNFDVDPTITKDLPSDSEPEQMIQKSRGRKKRGKNDDGSNWIDLQKGNMLPSSKTVAVKAQILNWLEEDPKCKIIVYAQFLNMIRIMAKICHEERWPHQQYHGRMSHEARAASIKIFEERSDVRILLASLKCGGVGLNLTMAQKVISIDPWWNSAVEQQAFGRVLRFGQKSETAMTRFVVENTVDQRIVEMQERKMEQIGRVMDGRRKKLTTQELMSLFGDTDQDGHGNHFIIVEDQQTFPNPADGDGEEHPAYEI